MPRVTLTLLLVAALLPGCERTAEVNVLRVERSPDGVREASIEEHIYGPHFGGEVPAVEVYIRRISAPLGQRGLVFQASSERNDVHVRWLSESGLRVIHSAKVPVNSVRQSYDGVVVELSAE